MDKPNTGWEKIKKKLQTRLGFTNAMCNLDNRTCKTTNTIVLIGSFIGLLLLSVWFLSSKRSKIVMDKEGHVDYTRVWVYSILIALVGPVLYMSYLLST